MSTGFNKFIQELQRLYKRKFIRYSIPFVTLVVGGSFFLKQFTQIRYKYSTTKTLTPEEAEKHGIYMKPREKVTLETQFEEIKSIDIDKWENKRIPRPWDENAQ